MCCGGAVKPPHHKSFGSKPLAHEFAPMRVYAWSLRGQRGKDEEACPLGLRASRMLLLAGNGLWAVVGKASDGEC